MKLGELSVCNMLECVVEPLVRVDLLYGTCSEEGIHHGSAMCALVRAREQVVFPAQCQWPDLVLNGVVVDQQAPVFEQCHEGRPLVNALPIGLLGVTMHACSSSQPLKPL